MTFPDGTPAAAAYPSGYSHIANEIYALGNRRPELFPNADDPAGESIRQAVAQLLGIPVQYYILIDMTGVVDTIDLFGGIDITVTEFINDSLAPIERGGPSLEIRTRPGDYHFDGHTTLAYLRSRLQSSDYNRMARQRCVVGALIDQVSAFSAIAKYTSLTDIISNHSTTDIPLRRLPDLLDVAARLDTSRITTLNFVPPDYPRGAAPTALVRSQVARVLAEPSDEPHEQITGACGSA
jgi:LCP family protein required for cell wall assembly